MSLDVLGHTTDSRKRTSWTGLLISTWSVCSCWFLIICYLSFFSSYHLAMQLLVLSRYLVTIGIGQWTRDMMCQASCEIYMLLVSSSPVPGSLMFRRLLGCFTFRVSTVILLKRFRGTVHINRYLFGWVDERETVGCAACVIVCYNCTCSDIHASISTSSSR